jgi:hypothetical protein
MFSHFPQKEEHLSGLKDRGRFDVLKAKGDLNGAELSFRRATELDPSAHEGLDDVLNAQELNELSDDDEVADEGDEEHEIYQDEEEEDGDEEEDDGGDEEYDIYQEEEEEEDN